MASQAPNIAGIETKDTMINRNIFPAEAVFASVMAISLLFGGTGIALGQGSGPVINSLSPALAIAGGSPFTLAIDGNNFVGSNVQWNGTPLTTTFVSATQLTALVPANLIASMGSASITVVNAGGATSAPAIFTIGAAPTPLSVVSLATLPSGSVGTYYSQSLYASGGTAPYTWSLISGSLPTGLSISSTGAITGTPTAGGTAGFTANVMDSAGGSALQTFSLPIGNTQSFTSAQRIAQIVDGGGWKTEFIITNTSQVPASYTFQFWGQNGSALALPILNGTAGTLTGTVAPGASVFAQTPGTSSTLQIGWGEVASSGPIRVTAFYQYQVTGAGSTRDSLGTDDATLSGNSIVMPYDDTQNNVTSIAIANTNATQPLQVTMLFETDGGVQSSVPLTLQPHSQQAVVLSSLNSAIAGTRGSVRFTAATPDIAVTGLEFTPNGQFTSLETYQ